MDTSHDAEWPPWLNKGLRITDFLPATTIFLDQEEFASTSFWEENCNLTTALFSPQELWTNRPVEYQF